MAYQFITQIEYEQYLSEAAKELLLQKKYISLPPLQQIRLLCLTYKNELANAIGKNKASDIEKLYLLGTRLVFQTRSFLLQDEIMFALGATSPEGKLETVLLSQDELFSQLRYSIKSGAMKLSESLGDLNITNQIDVDPENMWSKIATAASFSWPGDRGEQKLFQLGNGKYRKRFYRKNSADINVWVRFSGKWHTVRKYYQKQGAMMFFNDGWLYEWFLSFIQQVENVEKLKNSLNTETPLLPLMENSALDNIRGYQGGDFKDAYGRQIQAKMGNKKIISIKSINMVVDQLLMHIDNYYLQVNNPEIKKQQLAQNFMKLFSHGQETINREYDKIVDDMLKNLKLT